MKTRPRSVAVLPSAGQPSKGFTLIEMVVTLLVLSIVIILTLTLFDTNTRLAGVQTSVSDMQQNLRAAQHMVVRDLRASGRGALTMPSLPFAPFDTFDPPATAAMWVINNVPANTTIDPGGNYPVVEGTDILIVRGALSTPVWMILDDPSNYDWNQGAGTGWANVANTAISGLNIPQSIEPLNSAIDDNRADTLLFVSAKGDVFSRLATLDPGTSVQLADSVRLGFNFSPGVTWGNQMRPLAYVSLIEEYRYYVADHRAVAGDAGSSWHPRLMRARTTPSLSPPDPANNTSTPYAGDDSNWALEVADNIADLQIALGMDANNDGAITDSQGPGDEWMYNAPADTAPAGGWGSRLFYIRVTTLALAERPDRKYEAPDFLSLEDHDYTLAVTDNLNGTNRRQYRRRFTQTQVDLRNLF
ncbi:MAG: PilW family protein [Thermoanaerobaculia bacterium]|nr:PilW family protein [Thermoanaerobaculia bacterium]